MTKKANKKITKDTQNTTTRPTFSFFQGDTQVLAGGLIGSTLLLAFILGIPQKAPQINLPTTIIVAEQPTSVTTKAEQVSAQTIIEATAQPTASPKSTSTKR